MAGIKIDPEMLDIYMESLNKLMAGSETDGGNARLEVSGAGKTEDGLVQYNEEVNKLGDDLRELYETIRVNVDEEEQWKVFDFVEDFFMEELEIGDYINDINSYHLHMFDKHDVTTKKFDAIVEKAGKVDANYAAQIEGYCSLLGEYGKKFEAVCAMLQPEKLRLSPDKYREKLEGINTGYQNAKDTHEQEQSAYEAELYEIETVWYKKMLDKAEDYLIRSAECVVLGNFTDEVTVLGVGVQIVLGIFDLDLPCDIRDIIADVRNLAKADDIKWDMIAMLALDLIGVIPVIGALKYSDEIGTLFKNADKVSVVARSTDGAGVLAKHADEAGAWLHGVKVFRYSDETAEAVTSGEKLLTESGTIYESFADMMSPEDAKRYLDFLENGSREGLTSAELAGVEKADALLVSRKVEYEDVWDLRNVGDLLESGSKGGSGSFGIYSTKIDNKVRVIDKQELPSWLGKTFKDGNYRTVVTNEEIIVYRSFGHNAEAGGAFATSSPALNRVQTKIDSAILPEWKNTLRYEAEIVIPKGTTLNIGRVEEQFTMSGARLAGDADQFLLPENWDLNWIKSIREVKP